MEQKNRRLNIGLILAALIPLSVVLVLCGRSLWVIAPDLAPGQVWAMVIGLMLVALPGLTSAGVAWQSLRKDNPLTAKRIAMLIALLLSSGYVFLHIVEPRVFMRDWLFDHDEYMLTIASGLIPLFYYLLFCLASTFAIETGRGLVISIVAVVALPVVAYLGIHVIRFLPNMSAGGHLWQIGAITLTSAFSFFILRLAAYIVARNVAALQKPGNLRILLFIFVGLLPLIGLCANKYSPIARESQSMLGNFTSYEFWFLWAVNTVVYLLPDFRNPPLQFALIALRAAGFTFVLYFCAVFILFLPLAFLLIVAFGLGFLLLIPYFAAAAQIARLKMDFENAASAQGGRFTWTLMITGALLLPALALSGIYYDRAQLTAAIRFIEQPPLHLDYDPKINAETVLRLADMMPQQRNSGRGLRHNDRNVPIYDALYRQIVLDGAELSQSIRTKIHAVFGGGALAEPVRPLGATAELGNVAVAQKDDGTVTESTLIVTVVNPKTGRDLEFNETITLPPGAFLTDHWLTIDGVEMPAQITNRNTAIWVFNRVTEARRDPSLIYYEGLNTLRWRIFPVPAQGFRKARLVIKHAHDIEIKLADKTIALKAQSAAPVMSSETGKLHLIPPAAASEGVVRKPYLHFVADCHAGVKKDYRADAEAAAKLLGLKAEATKISFVHTAIHTTDLGETAQCPSVRDGFFSEMAIRAILHAQYAEASEKYPLVVVLSAERPNLRGAILSYMKVFYGDADGIAHFDGKRLYAASLSSGEWTQAAPQFNLPVRLYGGRFIAINQQLVFPAKKSAPGTAHNLLDGFEKFYDFYEGKTDSPGIAVLAAVTSGVLNPAAGSIVLETEAQRRRLAELHKKNLHARNQLDTGERPRMSEPWFFMIAVGLFFIILGWLKWRREKALLSRTAWFDEEN